MLSLGLVPVLVLWTLVCLGVGAWTSRAIRWLLPSRVAPVAVTREPAPAALQAYEAEVREALRDGNITEEERLRLRGLRQLHGLAPADHVRAVARSRSTAADEARPDKS